MEPWIWAIIIAVFLIIEFASIQLVSIWLAIGSVAGFVLSFIPGVNIWWQVLASILLALICIVFTRRFVKKWLSSRGLQTSIESLAGTETELLTPIVSNTQSGSVRINGVLWTAVSEKPIKAGKTVKVISMDGNKLCVEELKTQTKTENKKNKGE